MSKTLSIAAATQAVLTAALAAGHTITEDKARDLVKTANAKSMKRVNEIVEGLSKKQTRRIRSTRVIEAGKRGFNVKSKVWLDSVKAADGIATHPSNLPKLKYHAKAMGVSSAGTDMKALCEAIAAAGLTPAEEAAAE